MAKTNIHAEINGSVWKIMIKVGEAVAEDDTLAIVESMKMEIPVLSTCDGLVGEIFVVEGQPITEGEPIMSIDH
jgi:acetyl-CoA carboxylase biotin carboxyl carrier protein